MQIYFYKTPDDPRNLRKKRLTYHDLDPNNESTDIWEQSFNIINTGPIDLINPVVTLGYAHWTNPPDEHQTPQYVVDFDTTVNYAKMDARWYFVNNIVLDKGCKAIVSLTVDVLGTYADGILNAPCCITRSAKADLNWVTDTKFPINPSVKDFSKSTNFGESVDKFTGKDSYFIEVAEFKPYTWVDPNNNI